MTFLAFARCAIDRARDQAKRGNGLSALRSFAGPTILVSVAYLDPGNFATNIAGGARYGYRLLWVVVAANLIAMLFQALAAKLGIVSGRSLAETCRERLPALLVYPLWIVSEIGAMATDLAELLGASIGLSLLCGLPLLAGTLAVGTLTWGILTLERRHFHTIEAIVAQLIFVVGLCYVIETVLVGPDWRAVAYHAAVPWLGGRDSIMLAVGVIGATVMPHAIFLHSRLATNRAQAADPAAARRLIRASNVDILLTLGAVGLANMAIMYVSAATFAAGSETGMAGIESAYRTLAPLLGGMAAAIFMASLLASGLSSSVVGTLAGQVIMQDFVGWRIPLWVRRLATMAPTVAIVAYGVDPTEALVISQVVLSLVLPVPLITLVFFTSRSAVMGSLANGRAMCLTAVAAALLVIALNLLLLLETFSSLP